MPRGEGREKKKKKDDPDRKRRPKVCRFCVDRIPMIDYKDSARLRGYISDRAKIVPRRISGNCASHQRELTVAIKRARMLAMLPFAVS